MQFSVLPMLNPDASWSAGRLQSVAQLEKQKRPVASTGGAWMGRDE